MNKMNKNEKEDRIVIVFTSGSNHITRNNTNKP